MNHQVEESERYMSKRFRSPERKTPFKPNLGCGLRFEHDGMLMEIPAPKLPRVVHWRITTYRGGCPGAVHYYARLQVYGECADVLEIIGEQDYHKVSDSFSSNMFPKLSPYMDGWEVEVGYIAKQDVKSWSMFDGKDMVVTRKGEISISFDTFKGLKKTILSEFKRLFPGKNWELNDLNGKLEDEKESDYY